MNRPKKNKITNPTLPDDAQNSADERHLIDTEDAADISIEDRIHLYWMENRGFILGCILVLAFAIIGLNGLRLYEAHSQSKIQAAFAEAKASDDLASFSKAHADSRLGGFAALEVADAHYREGDFSAALEFYTIASSALENDLLAARARVGSAFALFYSGDEAQGIALLATLADDANVPDPIRQEVAYHLAVDADVKNDNATYEKYAAQLTDGGVIGPWQQRMQLYQRQR